MLSWGHRVAKYFELFSITSESAKEHLRDSELDLKEISNTMKDIKTAMDEIKDAIVAGLPPGQNP